MKLEQFYKLRELLKDFIPVISRIDRNVDKIYKDIEGEHDPSARDGTESHIFIRLENKRITILQWFSTVPYQSHHDLACEGRVEHTGTWLFKRKEFTNWENSPTPAILWLHGIRESPCLRSLWSALFPDIALTGTFVPPILAGAGKTKLV